jgi:hypothetical protein
MKFLAGVGLALLTLCTAAHADTPLDLYLQGKYDDATKAGRAQKDAEGFAIAARAELAAEAARTTPCTPCLQRAQAFAEKAIQLDHTRADGNLYNAIALGLEGRAEGILAAAGHGYAKSAKASLDSALADDPKNAFVWAALGGWNIEVVRNGGATLAHLIYGANVDDGLADFDKAFALNPGNVALRYQYALTLSGYDLNSYRPKIEDALARAIAGKPQGAYEAFAQQRARELLATLKQDDLEKYDQLVRRDQGYPP